MIFIVSPLVVVALIGLTFERRYARYYWGVIGGILLGVVLVTWGILHMVQGDRTSLLARAIFARPWLPTVVGPVMGWVLAYSSLRLAPLVSRRSRRFDRASV